MKDCCKNPENLIVHQDRADLLVKKCQICGLRHFELTVDPGRLGVVLKSL